jgi:hypothetical protein
MRRKKGIFASFVARQKKERKLWKRRMLISIKYF